MCTTTYCITTPPCVYPFVCIPSPPLWFGPKLNSFSPPVYFCTPRKCSLADLTKNMEMANSLRQPRLWQHFIFLDINAKIGIIVSELFTSSKSTESADYPADCVDL